MRVEGSLVLVLQDPHGLLLWPWAHVACLREERAGRLEATSADGQVAHRPGPLPDRPLPLAASGIQVNSAHVRAVGGRLLLPDGRSLPLDAPLPPVPTFPDPIVPGLGLPASAVLYLDREGWVTEHGRVPVRNRRRVNPPWLVPAGAPFVPS